jgi:hypothetical protein
MYVVDDFEHSFSLSLLIYEIIWRFLMVLKYQRHDIYSTFIVFNCTDCFYDVYLFNSCSKVNKCGNLGFKSESYVYFKK